MLSPLITKEMAICHVVLWQCLNPHFHVEWFILSILFCLASIQCRPCLNTGNTSENHAGKVMALMEHEETEYIQNNLVDKY